MYFGKYRAWTESELFSWDFEKQKEPPTKWPASYFRYWCSRSREVLICLLTFHRSTHISKFLACLGIKRPYSESGFLHMIFLKDTCLFKSCFDVFGKFMANALTEKLPGDFFYRASTFLRHFFINLSRAEIMCVNSGIILTHLDKVVFLVLQTITVECLWIHHLENPSDDQNTQNWALIM